MVIKTDKKPSPENNAVTLIGKHAEFDGNLKFFGTVRIDGKFKGTISGDGTVIICEDGIVEADIHVPNVIISGEVHGDIIADDRIDLRESGRVFGNIQAPVIKIDLGAILEGNCRIHQVKYSDEDETAMIQSVKPIELQSVAFSHTAS